MTNIFRIAAVATLVACGGSTVCDETLDKYEECGIEIPGGGEATGETPDGYCEDGTLEACTANCTLNADCGALDGTDADAAADYATCVVDCAGGGTTGGTE